LRTFDLWAFNLSTFDLWPFHLLTFDLWAFNLLTLGALGSGRTLRRGWALLRTGRPDR